MKPEHKYVAGTLAWCNKMRKKYKRGRPLKKLPKGEPEEPSSCPCGKATKLKVYTEFYTKPGDLYCKEYPVPNCVTSFVRNFDRGKLPQYEID